MVQFPSLAHDYHRRLPRRLWRYLLDERGLSERVVHAALLGWNGTRITIPIFDRERRFVYFKLAKDPEDRTDSPKMLLPAGAKAELYGWEHLRASRQEIVICEGEFDRLVLESRDIAAVTSTAGAGVFHPEWAEAFRAIPNVYVSFDNDEAGRKGAEHVARLIPQARIVTLPDDVGPGGDVTDFFVRLKRTREEFLALCAAARPLEKPAVTARSHEQRVSVSVPTRIEDLVHRYIPLRQTGANLVARCPFHADRTPSFVVFPSTQTFHCFGCQAHGDAITFLMRVERLTFREAIRALRNLCQKPTKTSKRA